MKDLNNEEQALPDNWEHLEKDDKTLGKDDKKLEVSLEINLLIKQQLMK